MQSFKNKGVEYTDKVGNLMIYISSRIDNLFLTKLLKLIYIIDETSVNDIGVPVTDLSYNVWEKGPVATKIYYDVSFADFEIYKPFVNRIKETSVNGYRIEPNNKFDDSEFSDYEINLIDKIIKDFGDFNSEQLISLLHKKDSLWHKIVVEKNLEESFERGDKTTNYTINLRDLIINEPIKSNLYDEVDFMNNL